MEFLPSARGQRLTLLAALLSLIAVAATLDLTALSWGQPGGIGWDEDSIGGVETTSELPFLAGPWRHRYPRLQFLINAALYKPLADRWARDPVYLLENGKVRASRFSPDRMERLILISRTITALMGIGAVIGVFFCGRLLFDDLLAAFLSGLALSLTQTFVLYSHMGNVDVPAAFWFVWAVYFSVKASVSRSWISFCLAGLMGALAGSTKEPLGGFVAGAGLALVLCLASSPARFPWMRVPAGAGTTLVVFALLNDLVTYPAAFLARMSFWIGGPGVTQFNMSYRGQPRLLWNTMVNLYLSVGWPLLAAAAVGLFWCLRRDRRAALFALLPLVVFYLAVIVNVRMVTARFLIPGFAGLALLAGKGSAQLLRLPRIPGPIRTGLVGLAFGISALYCIGLDLEMLADTRYEAEAWFVRVVGPEATVASLASPTVSPRLGLYGMTYDCRWTRPIREEILMTEPARPDYLILNEKLAQKPALFDPAFHQALMDGSIGYRQAALFTNQYLYPARTLFGLAGWGAEHLEQVSPRIRILRRVDPV